MESPALPPRRVLRPGPAFLLPAIAGLLIAASARPATTNPTPAPIPAPAPAANLLPTPTPTTTPDEGAEAVLQRGLIAEESRRDLESAIAAYQRVIRTTDDQRRLAATAVFRLGECYRKTGRTNEAVAQYQRLLRDFSAEEVLARLSRQNLAALGAPAPPPAPSFANTPLPGTTGSPTRLESGSGRDARGPDPDSYPVTSSSGRARQIALLEEEMNLLDRQLTTARLRLEKGIDTQAEIWKVEREILQLRRQLVGLQDPPKLPDILVDASPGAASSKAELDTLVARIAEFEQRSPNEASALTAFLEAFPDPELADVRKKLKEAEQRLSSLQSNTDDNASEIGSTESEISRLKNRRRARWDAVLADQRARAQTLGAAPAPDGAGGEGPSAADAAEVARLRALITQSPDLLDAPTGDPSMAPLHRAAANGQLAVARFLVERGADLNNPRSPQNWSPLHHAAARGHKAVVELLLAKGANPNAKANDASTPLHQAVNREYREVVRALIAGGADVEARGWSGATRIVQRRDGQYSERDGGHTALHLAAQSGLTNLVSLLLEAKADPNATNSFARTPLHQAVETAQYGAVTLLLAAGADPNRVDRAGNTPFHVALGIRSGDLNRNAVKQADATLVQMLLAAHADPNLPDGAGRTPLAAAIVRGRDGFGRRVGQTADTQLLATLLQAGAAVDGMGSSSDACLPPLHEAVASDDLGAVRLLLEARAKPNLVAGDGEATPLHLAVQNRNRAMVELLLANGADPNLRNKAGLTPEELVNPKPSPARAGGGIPVGVSPSPFNPGIQGYVQGGAPGAIYNVDVPDSSSRREPASAEELAALLKARTTPAPASTNTIARPRD